MAVTLAPLPPYPSTRARESLTPSQAATLAQTVSIALSQALPLSDAQLSSLKLEPFLASYAKDVTQQALHALVWDTRSPSTTQAERKIRHTAFLLVERLAPLGTLGLPALVDLGVAYSQVSPPRLRAVFAAALVQSPSSAALLAETEKSAVPAFTTLLSAPSQGLYGLRKTAHILLCFLRSAPPSAVRLFARNKAFVCALASVYHSGLVGIAEQYGGLRALASLSAGSGREPDEWERLFLDTKMALLDTFHVLVRTLLDDVASVSTAGAALATQAEPAFDVVFGLLDLASPSTDGLPQTPFLNRPLLADYQHAYDFAKVLQETMKRTEDARADLIGASLREMAAGVAEGSREPGVLRIVLRSSGVPPGADNLGRGSSGRADAKNKGKNKDMGQALGSSSSQSGQAAIPDELLDTAVVQVLDLFPDQDPSYLRYVLAHPDYPYKGDAEKLIAALLDGAAPPKEDVDAAIAGESEVPAAGEKVAEDEFVYTRERRNVFDDDVMDLSRLRIGKNSDDANTVLQDRSFIEQMKADILRRAEEISDDEYEEETGAGGGRALAFEDELDEEGAAIKVRDGDASDDAGGEDDGDGDGAGVGSSAPHDPETVLELAFIDDPTVFERDGQTRRSRARADLKARTGWSDEQIEGWRIMLERDPRRKEKVLKKHEFAGNKPFNVPISEAESSRASSPARGGAGSGARARGRGGGRGRGRGRRGGGGGRGGGQGGSQGGGGGDQARDRAWKDKNKARQGNHDRKRGRDKKMARAGGPS